MINIKQSIQNAMEKPHISQIETKFADGLFAVERILVEHTCIQKLNLLWKKIKSRFHAYYFNTLACRFFVYIYGHSSIEVLVVIWDFFRMNHS